MFEITAEILTKINDAPEEKLRKIPRDKLLFLQNLLDKSQAGNEKVVKWDPKYNPLLQKIRAILSSETKTRDGANQDLYDMSLDELTEECRKLTWLQSNDKAGELWNRKTMAPRLSEAQQLLKDKRGW